MSIIECEMLMAKGRPKLSKEENETRKTQIIGIAKQLFIKEGYQSVSMRKIASEAGLSPMTLYKSFENKRDLLRFIWTDIFVQVHECCEEAITLCDNDIEKLHAFCGAFVNYWLTNPEHYRVVYLESDQLESIDDSYFADDEIITKLFMTLGRLVAAVAPQAQTIDDKIKLLVLQLQGIAHGLITIKEIPWGAPDMLTDQCITGFIRLLEN